MPAFDRFRFGHADDADLRISEDRSRDHAPVEGAQVVAVKSVMGGDTALASADRRYNRPVRLPYPARHERLWRDDRLYDVVVVLDYNLARPRPGAGGAIFLHIATPDFSPTAGCIALQPDAMRRLLALVGPRTAIDVR